MKFTPKINYYFWISIYPTWQSSTIFKRPGSIYIFELNSSWSRLSR